MRLQRRLNSFWAWLGEDRRGSEILMLLLLLNALALIIPQSPIPSDDSVAQLRWLVQTSATWKGSLHGLDAVKLTQIRTSLWMRLPLAWLALITAAHIDKSREHWGKLVKPANVKMLLFNTGSILVILGWALQILLGWIVPSLTAWPDKPMLIPERDLSIPTCTQWMCIWPGKPGLYLVPAGSAVGVDVQAANANGTSVLLIPAAKTDPQQRLQIALTEPVAESFFLIPDAGRIVRLNENNAETGSLGVTLQAYDSQSGALLAEEILPQNTMTSVSIEPVTISAAVHSLSQYDAVYNPGAVAELLGFVLWISSLPLGKMQTVSAETQQDETENKET